MGNKTDQEFMMVAIKEAEKSYKEGELPVGAVVVLDNKIIGRGRRIKNAHPKLDHAEIRALRQAINHQNSKQSSQMIVYSTLEPCAMCFGAILNCKIGGLVFALEDPYGGFTHLKSSEMPFRHQKDYPKISKGVLKERTSDLFKKFLKKTQVPFWKDASNPLVKMFIEGNK